MRSSSCPLLALVLVAGCAKPANRVVTPVPVTPVVAPKSAPVAAKPADDPERLPSTILARCKAATVLIGNFEGGKLRSTGSGVVLSDGKTVVTNRHVVVGEDSAPDALKLVFFAGTEKARIVQVKPEAITILEGKPEKGKNDHDDDIAAIRLTAQVAPPLDVAKDAAAEETASAWAFGFPNGMDIRRGEDQIPSPTVHTMRIERVERKKGETTVLQFGGSVTYGDSGGPVVTRSGEVLGVMQALADGRSSIVYALPGKSVRAIVAKVKNGGSGALASAFAAPLDPGEKKPVRTRERGRDAERPSDPGPISGATSSLANFEIDEETMDEMSAMALTVLRNEPFARRGYIFKRSALRRVFAGSGWYEPRTRNMAACQRRFTSTERRNVDRIMAYQKSSGKQW